MSSSAYGPLVGFTVVEVGIAGSSSIGSCCLSVEGSINHHISAVSTLLFTTTSHSSQSLGEERTMITGRAGWEDDDIFGCYLSPRIDRYMLTMCVGVCWSRQGVGTRIEEHCYTASYLIRYVDQ